jgi:putative membrane protein
MLEATIAKNDKRAYWIIGIFSVVVFGAIVALGNFKLDYQPGFDVHIFAKINAVINSCVAVLLIMALVAIKNNKYELHRNLMLAAMFLSVLFLVSYIAHHLLAGEAKFGDLNHDGLLDAQEKLQAGSLRIFYLLLLATHIVLAAIILPFILFTAYRALTSEWPSHKKLAKYTWPLWLYVAITGPIIYYLISPYYT